MARADSTTGDNYMRLLGFEVEQAGPGEAGLSALVREEHLNLHGSAHGGFLYSLADAAFALASNGHAGVAAVALNTSMQYHRAVRAGSRVRARAREVHLGRRVASYQIELRVEEVLVGSFTGTVYRMEGDKG